MKVIRVCNCRSCRRRRHSARPFVRAKWKKFRQQERAAIRRGEEPPIAIGGGYRA